MSLILDYTCVIWEVFEHVNSLHLKVLMAYELVQLFQVDYWSVFMITVFIGDQKKVSKSHPPDMPDLCDCPFRQHLLDL